MKKHRSILPHILIIGIFFLFASLYLIKNTSSVPSKESTSAPLSEISSESGNVIVTHPSQKQTINGSFILSGRARVFENVVSLRLTNQRTNKVLTQDRTEALSPDTGQFGPFTYTFRLGDQLDLKNGDELLLEVFQFSAKDGSEIDKVSLTLSYQGN